jgi:large subunit ribosomal protein L28
MMARQCEVCGKKGQYGAKVSHAHNVTKTKRQPNLHRVWAKVAGKKKRMLVCTKCLKSGKIEKA